MPQECKFLMLSQMTLFADELLPEIELGLSESNSVILIVSECLQK